MIRLHINTFILYTVGTEERGTGRRNERGGLSLPPSFSPVRMQVKSNHHSVMGARVLLGVEVVPGREAGQMNRERQQMSQKEP